MAKSKRQMTAAKRAREQTLRDRRLRKQEKKQLRAQGITPPTEDSDSESEAVDVVENSEADPA